MCGGNIRDEDRSVLLGPNGKEEEAGRWVSAPSAQSTSGFCPPAASIHLRQAAWRGAPGHVGGRRAHTDTEFLLLSEQVSELHRGQCPVLPHHQGTLRGNKVARGTH